MSQMSKKNWTAWMDRTERLNVARSIQVGDLVTDFLLRSGKVVRISLPEGGDPTEDHGTVEVHLEDDVFESYTFTQWKRHLRLH